ncbi:permease prefix domain 1-containing protein [Cellulomonas soli]|uniref:permease prefix domain 1-containing protein n=1 Tax=Cellulomonas soli TaxID=931535 RepID=UPI003F86F4DC
MTAELEARIDQWRGYVQRRQAIAPADVDELEDHLRGQVADLCATGLAEDEAFLIGISRLGALDTISREFALEHSERLWKQLVLVPQEPGADGTPAHRELAVVLGLAVGAGLAVKAGLTWIDDAGTLARNLGLLLAPFLAAYFAWKRRLTGRTLVALAVPYAVLAVLLNVYPFEPDGSTEVLAALHAPVVLWVLIGIAYAAGRWRSDARRMDFVRFTGELAIYYALIALGGGVLVGLTAAVLQLVGIDVETAMAGWVLPFAAPGALLVAAWLVEAKKDVVENIAPVLTRVFTPLTIVMLLAVLVALGAAGGFVEVDRDLLIAMDAILVLVLSLLLYSISARDPLAPPGVFDALQLVLVVAALAVDALLLTAMVTRIAEFGSSPNKAAALGLNLLLLVHLVRAGWLTLQFLRRRCGFAALERWQTRYLPVYGLWAACVVVVLPPVFGFA